MTENNESDCLESKVVNQHLIIKLNGDCFVDDDHIRETGLKLVKAVTKSEERYLLVNLENIKILSSMMIGQLVNLRNKCEAAKLEFQICNLSPTVSEALRIMNLEELLNVFETEDAAIESAKVR